MLDKYISKLNLISSLEDYTYIIGIKKGKVENDLISISNDDLFYLLDNGDPTLGILPKNIKTDFHFFFINNISPELQSSLIDGILNKNWNEVEIKSCFERFIPLILNWFYTKISVDNIVIKTINSQEIISLKDFSKNIYCKVEKLL